MPVISCTHCGAKGNAPDSVLGQTVRCSKCKQSFVASASGSLPEAVAVVEEDRDEGIQEAEEDPNPRPRRGRDDDDEPDDEPEDDAPRARRKPRGASVGSGVLFDILLVRQSLGPYLLVAIFYVGSLYFVWVGFSLLIQSFRHLSGWDLFLGVFHSLGIIVGGPIFMRVACEVTNSVFSIHSMMADQMKQRKESEPSQPPK